ncbi:MAG TPA: hypothetical protein VFU21_03950 [Kofleriaceae bacterium]|nr:hypothetical protein [Kofleriaceae bacterium]
MRSLALCLATCLAACGADDDGGDAPAEDAAPDDRADAGSGVDAGPSATCEEYCTVLTDACQDSFRQYRDLETCLASCALFPPGQAGDESGDSVACRAHHAELSLAEPDPHCYHAGPSGDGVCGDPCDGYCDLMVPTCQQIYADDGECMAVCAGFPDPRPYTVHEDRVDTAACRLVHATRATVDDGHCGSAGPDSSTCVDQ